VRALAFSPQGDLLAVAGDSGDIHLWRLNVIADGPRLLGRHIGPIWSIDFHPTGRWLATAGEDATVRTWQIVEEDIPTGRVVHRHAGWVVSVRYSPDGNLLASGADDGRVLVTSIDASSPIWLSDPASHQAWGLEWTRTKPYKLFVGGRDGAVRKWDIAGPRLTATYSYARWIWSCSCAAADGDVLWVTGDGGMMSRLRASDLTLIGTEFASRYVRTRSLSVSEAVAEVATASDDGVVRLWKLEGGILVECMPDRQYERLSVAGASGLSGAQLSALHAMGAIGQSTDSIQGEKSVSHRGQSRPVAIEPRKDRIRLERQGRDPWMVSKGYLSAIRDRSVLLLVLTSALLVLVLGALLIYLTT
jgi:WD40 repeat protein